MYWISGSRFAPIHADPMVCLSLRGYDEPFILTATQPNDDVLALVREFSLVD